MENNTSCATTHRQIAEGRCPYCERYINHGQTIAAPESEEYFRNGGNAIHQSHLVLGRAALHEGDLDRAKWHLVESGKTKGSPVLGSFGPNMSLAKDLLEAGERAVVLEYLEQCGKFWKCGTDALAHWKGKIAADRIPEFGANLDYY